MEILGLVVSVIGLVTGIAMAFYPPGAIGQKRVHLAYICGFLFISFVLGALMLKSKAETADALAQVEVTKAILAKQNQISTQSSSLRGSLGGIGSESCRGIVLASFSFLEKWKTDLPETFEVAKGFMQRSNLPLKGGYLERTNQQDECMRDALAMRQLLDGLSQQ